MDSFSDTGSSMSSSISSSSDFSLSSSSFDNSISSSSPSFPENSFSSFVGAGGGSGGGGASGSWGGEQSPIGSDFSTPPSSPSDNSSFGGGNSFSDGSSSFVYSGNSSGGNSNSGLQNSSGEVSPTHNPSNVDQISYKMISIPEHPIMTPHEDGSPVIPGPGLDTNTHLPKQEGNNQKLDHRAHGPDGWGLSGLDERGLFTRGEGLDPKGYDRIDESGGADVYGHLQEPSGQTEGFILFASGFTTGSSGQMFGSGPDGSGLGNLSRQEFVKQLNYDTKLISWDEQEKGIVAIEQFHANHPDAPIVLIGHSFGGDSVVQIADALEALNIAVDKLILIDSVGTHDDQVPHNVDEALNIYSVTPGLINGETDVHGAHNVGLNDTSHTEIDNDPRAWNLIEHNLYSHGSSRHEG